VSRIVLPSRPRRAWLRAFNLTAALWVATGVGALSPLAPLPRAAVAALAAAVIIGAAAVFSRQTEYLYRLWVRGSRLYARIARWWLLALCHAVFSIVGVAGSSLILARPAPGGSMWQDAHALSTEAYASQFEGRGHGWPGRPWRSLFDWTARSDNVWFIFVIPLVFLLSALDTGEPAPQSTDIYTLF
jgi:hypothetical protein